MVLDALFVTSSALMALITYTPGLLGGWYVAEEGVTLVNVPLDALQVTPWLLTSFCTVAENFKACDSVMPPRLGETVTPRSVGIPKTVIVELADELRSVTDVAVSMTVGGFGAVAGAV